MSRSRGKAGMMLPPAFLALSILLPLRGGEDSSPHTVFPSPRASGLGQIVFSSSNVQLLGWKTMTDFPGNNVSANDCWGYTAPSGREYAILGLSNGTGFVEVTDPGNPVVIDFESGPSSLWRGVKTYSTYAYAVSEAGGGIQVFNLASIDTGVVTLQTTVTTGGCTTASHTLAVNTASGYLYRAGGGGGPCSGGPQGLVIYSLANPALPTVVATWNTRYVHECQVTTWTLPGPYLGKELAFCYSNDGSGGGNPRLTILDVTNKASIVQVSSTSYTGSAYSHQGWVTSTGGHLYLNDELDDGSFGGARTRVFSLANLAAPTYLGFYSSGAPSIDHNLYVKGNRVYESNYRSGLRIFDNTTPTAPVQVGYFDTWPSDDAQLFNSLWSNYPYFASGTVLGSDVEKGLFVWREGAAPLTLGFAGGDPLTVDPQGGELLLDVQELLPGSLVAGSVRLHHSDGGPFGEVVAQDLGSGTYRATLPGYACGARVALYLSAQTTDGVTWTYPPAAPTQAVLASAAYLIDSALLETFESATGWTTSSTATGGNWTRVNPIGTSAQPEDDVTPAGTFCYVTGQGVVGGADGDADVDGGTVTLTSPSYDLSALSDPHVAYWRWWSNKNEIFGVDDPFRVDISNNGGGTWVTLELLPAGHVDGLGGWIRQQLRVADFVAPTSNVRLRFLVSDTGAGSLVEAALDDLEILDHDCTTVTLTGVTPSSGSFDGGELVTLTGTEFTPGTSVTFGANPAAVTFVSPTTLTVRVPRAPGPVGGKTGRLSSRVDVTVTTPGHDTLVNGYTYVLPQRNL